MRKLSSEAKDVADTYFFESLVRTHRADEGAPYTGLKLAGRDLGPAIPAADKALEDGSIEPVAKLLTGLVQDEIQQGRRGDRAEVCGDLRYLYHYVEGIYPGSTESGARSLRGTTARASTRGLIGNPKKLIQHRGA